MEAFELPSPDWRTRMQAPEARVVGLAWGRRRPGTATVTGEAGRHMRHAGALNQNWGGQARHHSCAL